MLRSGESPREIAKPQRAACLRGALYIASEDAHHALGGSEGPVWLIDLVHALAGARTGTGRLRRPSSLAVGPRDAVSRWQGSVSARKLGCIRPATPVAEDFRDGGAHAEPPLGLFTL